ncbi:hypothetical protein ACFGVR_10465 [Mucilaginibacter sp. AW1-3]
MKKNTEPTPQTDSNALPKKAWKSPELVVINQSEINLDADTWPGSGQENQSPEFYKRIKKSLRVKNAE